MYVHIASGKFDQGCLYVIVCSLLKNIICIELYINKKKHHVMLYWRQWHHLDKSWINILSLTCFAQNGLHRISYSMRYFPQKSILTKQINDSIYIYIYLLPNYFLYYKYIGHHCCWIREHTGIKDTFFLKFLYFCLIILYFVLCLTVICTSQLWYFCMLKVSVAWNMEYYHYFVYFPFDV